MKMKEIIEETKLKSFYYSLSYVGVGTLALFAMGSRVVAQNEMISAIISIINIVTMPVCFLGFGILYSSGREAWFFALMAQMIVFLIFWYFAYKYLLRKSIN